jgi:hypothetical protein
MNLLTRLTLVAVLTAVGTAGTQAQNLVANGDFTANAAGYTTFPGYNGGANPATIASWTGYTDESGKGLNGALTGFGNVFGPVNDGGYTYAFIQNPGALYQFLPLAVSTTYTLDFDVAGRAGFDADTFAVKFGDPLTPFWDSGNIAANEAAFTHYTYNFTTPGAFAGPVTIQLWNVGGAGDTAVDFANVALVVVPEPTTAVLAGLGLLLVGAIRRSTRYTA